MHYYQGGEEGTSHGELAACPECPLVKFAKILAPLLSTIFQPAANWFYVDMPEHQIPLSLQL